MEHVQNAEGGREDLIEALFGVDAQRMGRGPDSVSTEVIEEEMSLFRSASRTLGGG
jgi:hypothetical protein